MLNWFNKQINKMIAILVSINFLLSLYLISNIYEYRINFAKNESLNVVKEKLQIETDLLLKELEEQRSQLTLRKIAIGKLNMITPSNKNLIFINKKGKMHE